MTQSGWIAAFLLAGFVLFLAARDRLGTYAAVLWGGKSASTNAPSSGSSKSSDVIGQIGNVAGQIGEVTSGVGATSEASHIGATIGSIFGL